MEPVNYKLLDIALARVSGKVFEDFAQTMLSSTIGTEFVPLGGVQDGGADGFLQIESGQQTAFVQISTQETYREKIRRTVQRLREFGRDPQQLHYVTSRTIQAIDRTQHQLGQELGVAIVIRDSKWIRSNINHSDATIQAFNTYLYPDLHYLRNPGAAHIVQDSLYLGDARTVCVFLRQEVDRRAGEGHLLQAVVDSLLLWALEGTDPDKNKLMSRDDITRKVNHILPLTHVVNSDFIGRRLETMSSKANSTGREVRWHKKVDKFCLPFETRVQVQEENVEDDALRIRVQQALEARAQSVDATVLASEVARIALLAIQMTFEARGLTLAAFLQNEDGDPGYQALTIASQVDGAMTLSKLTEDHGRVKSVAMAVIRQALYESTEDERLYFGKLSRTYSLFLTLKMEPKVVSYFRSMSSQLTLFVGTDILVRCLSERYLRKDDRMTCNLLFMLRECGSSLVLAQPTLDELCSHLNTTDLEFQDRYEGIEEDVTVEVAEHEPRILIRAYFYARLSTVEGIRAPTSWPEFINQICTYRDLNRAEGRGQIRRYLSEKFGLVYMEKEELAKVTQDQEVADLADRIEEVRSKRHRVLAENDARMVLAVYGTRKQQREEQRNNPFGYRTWWLTEELGVVRATREIIRKYGGKHIIRPEFLLHYIAFAPSTEQARRAFKKVFPTLLGIKLSNRMKDDQFDTLMKDAKDVAAVDDARARVMLGELSDKLKSGVRVEGRTGSGTGTDR